MNTLFWMVVIYLAGVLTGPLVEACFHHIRDKRRAKEKQKFTLL